MCPGSFGHSVTVFCSSKCPILQGRHVLACFVTVSFPLGAFKVLSIVTSGKVNGHALPVAQWVVDGQIKTAVGHKTEITQHRR